jgi:hypothetical protein
MLNQKVTAIGEDYIETDCGGSLTQIPAGTIVWVAGIEASKVTAQAAGTLPSFGRGRIETDAFCARLQTRAFMSSEITSAISCRARKTRFRSRLKTASRAHIPPHIILPRPLREKESLKSTSQTSTG